MSVFYLDRDIVIRMATASWNCRRRGGMIDAEGDGVVGVSRLFRHGM